MMELIVLRPWAFIFILPAVLYCFFNHRPVKAWIGVIDARLLPVLSVRAGSRLRKNAAFALSFAAALCVVCALAGVCLKRTDAPLYHPKPPAVIVLDMSLSMKARDVEPNRFSRAVFKVYDLLDELRGVPTALVVFTDEPYPLISATTQKEAVEAILPLLNFNLMPSQGSRTDRALDQAVRAIEQSGAAYGDIFFVTDGGDEVFDIQDRGLDIVRRAAEKGTRLFVLGTGTPAGAVLPAEDGRNVLDALGNPVTHRLREDFLRRLAAAGNGEYARVRTDDGDVKLLMRARNVQAGRKSDLTDLKRAADAGYWFLLPVVALFPFVFRRGLFPVLLLLWATPAAAASVQELFFSPSAAAAHFLNLGNQGKAVEIAEKSDDFTALYNTGTRLIALRNFAAAQMLLEKAVLKRPDDENAQVNLEIAKRLNKNPPSDGEGGGDAPDPDQSGDGEGNADGQNDLNQNNNNTLQDDENKENDSNGGTGDDNDGTPEKEGGASGGAGGNGDGDTGNNGDSAGDDDGNNNGNDGGNGGAGGNGDGDGDGNSDAEDGRGDMIPVHDDPSALLRHKILFLYQEKRYGDEPAAGAPW